MRNFIEAQHPRGNAGSFVDRTHTPPEVRLALDGMWAQDRFDRDGGPEEVIDHGRRYRGVPNDEPVAEFLRATPERPTHAVEAERAFRRYARFETAALLTPTSHAEAIDALNGGGAPEDAGVRLVTMTQRASTRARIEVSGPDPSWDKPILVDVQSGEHEFSVVSGRAIVQVAHGLSTIVRVAAGASAVLILAGGARASVRVANGGIALVNAPAGSSGQLVLAGRTAFGTITGSSRDFGLVARVR
jgi:hypothetical protein